MAMNNDSESFPGGDGDGTRFHLVPCWAMEEAPLLRRRSSRLMSMRSARVSIALGGSEEEPRDLGTLPGGRRRVAPLEAMRIRRGSGQPGSQGPILARIRLMLARMQPHRARV